MGWWQLCLGLAGGGAQLSWLCVYSLECGKLTKTGWVKGGQARGLLAACAVGHTGGTGGSTVVMRTFLHCFPRSQQLNWASGERCHVLHADTASPPTPARDKAPAGAQARCGETAICSPQVPRSPGRQGGWPLGEVAANRQVQKAPGGLRSPITTDFGNQAHGPGTQGARPLCHVGRHHEILSPNL